ncbi:DUF1643 domain-containing protein [Adonisia turfae]|uniref:DUF1643 domain-containing protein n=1 Tax=Adonisia turfae CCMR0081 TaxID=2292702 RepID=A0A6M0RG21_9CYAN|nr:DUF1643 domain-containing protein [Adonisia turfae]NEZ55196.1 DUF1643 domain-containing protein [Adonisia turfae CCMR0081]
MLTIVTNSIKGTATFDASYRYRYRLTRSWLTEGQNLRQVTFIMLNPSEADAEKDDPTIRACSQFAQRWEYTQLNIVNLFAHRTSQPSILKHINDPIGPENNRYLHEASATADAVILAWGNWGSLLNRHQDVLDLLAIHHHKFYCLARNQSGQPRHPLYIKRTTRPTPWQQNS